MPREWYDKHAISKIEDEEIRELYFSIVADKKPYFMRYIYPTLMSQYNTYIKNTEKNALREFGMTVPELKSKAYEDLTERQIEFLRYYHRGLPVGTNDCVMNQICRKFEAMFDGIARKKNLFSTFDYTIMKSDAEYTTKQYNEIKKVFEAYNKRLSNFKSYAEYERVDESDSIMGLERIKEEFLEECDKICPDPSVLCNIILDVCYSRNTTKRFAWSVCGSEIIKNLLSKSDNKISYPTLDEDGEFEYGGNRFTIETKELEVSE